MIIKSFEFVHISHHFIGYNVNVQQKDECRGRHTLFTLDRQHQQIVIFSFSLSHSPSLVRLLLAFDVIGDINFFHV